MAAATLSILPSPSASHLIRRRRSIRCLSSPTPTPPATILSQDDLKKLSAVKAVEYVKSGMVLGLGTGSTAAFVVSEIGALLSAGKLSDIIGIPTSKRTFEQAKSLGIPLSTLDEHPRLDLAIDGADEVNIIEDWISSRLGLSSNQTACSANSFHMY